MFFLKRMLDRNSIFEGVFSWWCPASSLTSGASERAKKKRNCKICCLKMTQATIKVILVVF